MTIGIPKEIKAEEYRVGILPETVAFLTRKGHTVLAEKNAGSGAGITDKNYENAGAEIVPNPQRIYQKSDG